MTTAAPSPQLDLFAPPDKKNVRWLESWLDIRPGWHTALAILTSIYPEWSTSEFSDTQKRALRAYAQESEWIISGQKGYKHLSAATAEEVAHFVNWMESQAREMTRRAELIRKNAHKIFG
jgi:hypothetical protein